MNTRAWPAPAKLNLFLRITGRRTDGYHTLQTVFQFLDYGDALRFRVRDDGVIRALHRIAGVGEEHDLCLRAAKLLQRAGGVGQGADIELDKRLPLGAGLGGGSSDAATTVLALNRLWGLHWPEDKLAQLGLQLGADVPVFVRGVAAWAEGVGEQLTPLELDEPWYVVLTPDCQVSTREIFNAPDLTRNSAPITMRAFIEGAERPGNDCEAAVCKRHPAVRKALDRLMPFAPARMTGTGSAVFAAFAEEARARAVLSEIAAHWPPGWQGFVAQGKNRSPLHEMLAGEQY
ncbi:MAG: 4-(cytidine 5'-diphospho)-2-C-methyl-D-erythritol kinase [Gammaproteobacteria bacterium]|nr:MAG: 4-(cytidine 5'-diphospho)-2-C-methyl-D-erythritol kinase [Gammaproteobacteria bacterium]